MKKVIRYLLPCFCLFLCMGAIFSGQMGKLATLGEKTGAQGEQQRFLEYLDQLFREEITANTINLHYTLKNPDQYGIREYPVTLGQVNTQESVEATAMLENMQAALKSFDSKKLDPEYAMIYDMLEDEVELELGAARMSVIFDDEADADKTVSHKCCHSYGKPATETVGLLDMYTDMNAGQPDRS